MLPPIESDETLVASGTYQQIRRGENTRVQETWSMHSLPDAAQIWRSQLLYNGAVLISSCYLLRAPDGRPVQLIFFWRWPEGHEDFVEYRFNGGYATVVHKGHAQEMILPADFVVYGWHTITENFLWNRYDRRRGGTQSFTIVAPGIQSGTVKPSLMAMEARLKQNQILPSPDGPTRAYIFEIDMPQMGPQEMCFDAFGVPLSWSLEAEDLKVELVEYSRVD